MFLFDFCSSNHKLLKLSFQLSQDFNQKLHEPFTNEVSTLLIFLQFSDEIKFVFNPLAKVPLEIKYYTKITIQIWST